MKKQLYNFIIKHGIRAMQRLFPEYFANQPLEATDRYIEYNFVMRNLPPLPATILDVGCAGSYFPLILAGAGYKVRGIDIRPYPLELDNFTFCDSNVLNCAWHTNPVDIAICVSTLEHIGIGGRYGVMEDLCADKKAVDIIMKLCNKAIFTIPFGKHKIIRPDTRIYDNNDINALFMGYKFKAEFWTDHGHWKKSLPIEKDVDNYNYDLACLVVEK